MRNTKARIARGAKSMFRVFGMDLRRYRGLEHILVGMGYRIEAVIDVGANAGQFAGEVLDKFHDAVVYCVEPLPEMWGALDILARSAPGRVEVFRCALGEAPGRTVMHRNPEHSPSSSLLPFTKAGLAATSSAGDLEEVNVDVETLDGLFGDGARLTGDTLLKLDVQGYEDRVLRGGQKTLTRVVACMLEVSIGAFYEGQACFESLVEQLSASGLRYAGNVEQIFTSSGSVSHLDALFVRPRQDG